MGAFVIAIDPEAFAGGGVFRAAMERYLTTLRSGPAVPGAVLMAPGDREWAEAARRSARGIPVDPETRAAFAGLAAEHGVQELG